ncbi:hypothetical protein ZWY2020_001332 [Hordeum vulgare]|nr:hypothetical protein ZWY2020_001332 [Hordeum vulgare]
MCPPSGRQRCFLTPVIRSLLGRLLLGKIFDNSSSSSVYTFGMLIMWHHQRRPSAAPATFVRRGQWFPPCRSTYLGLYLVATNSAPAASSPAARALRADQFDGALT